VKQINASYQLSLIGLSSHQLMQLQMAPLVPDDSLLHYSPFNKISTKQNLTIFIRDPIL